MNSILKVVTASLVLSACSFGNKEQSFGLQSCFVVYCSSSENYASKDLALKAIEVAASIYSINLDTKNGICTKYYDKREMANGYIYLAKSAKQVCSEFKENLTN